MTEGIRGKVAKKELSFSRGPDALIACLTYKICFVESRVHGGYRLSGN